MKANIPQPDVEQEPMYDRVIIWRHEAEEKERGLYVPDTAKLKTCEATVIAVGDGRISADGTRVRPTVKPGDTIIIGRYVGTEVPLKVNGRNTTFVYITEDEIFSICR